MGFGAPDSRAPAFANGSMYVASSTPPPAIALTRRNCRRSTAGVGETAFSGVLVFMGVSSVAVAGAAGAIRAPAVGRRRCRRLVNGVADPQVRAASADIPVHRRVDVSVARIGVSREQRRSRHDLAGLAVAALRNVDRLPCL